MSPIQGEPMYRWANPINIIVPTIEGLPFIEMIKGWWPGIIPSEELIQQGIRTPLTEKGRSQGAMAQYKGAILPKREIAKGIMFPEIQQKGR